MPRSEEQQAGKVTPQNLDAERSLLGAILRDDSIFPDILEKLSPEDFYDKKHAAIYRVMKTLYEHNQPIDLLTTKSELSKDKLLKEVGGAAYLAALRGFRPHY